MLYTTSIVAVVVVVCHVVHDEYSGGRVSCCTRRVSCCTRSIVVSCVMLYTTMYEWWSCVMLCTTYSGGRVSCCTRRRIVQW